MSILSFLRRTVLTTPLLIAAVSSYLFAAVPAAPVLSAVARSTSSIEWGWPAVPSIDGYYLYSTTAPERITIPAGTTYYIDKNLRANTQVIRYISAFAGITEGPISNIVSRYSYAELPDPEDKANQSNVIRYKFNYYVVNSTQIAIVYAFSNATTYRVETSTDTGTTWAFSRDLFLPYQNTIPALPNKEYLLRLGVYNGDYIQTPNLYLSTSSVKTGDPVTTPPPFPNVWATAISSCCVIWQWGPVESFAAMGVIGYEFYRSTSTDPKEIPTDNAAGQLYFSVDNVYVSSMTEVYTASGTYITTIDSNTYINILDTTTYINYDHKPCRVDNSPHTYWLKAIGKNGVRSYYLQDKKYNLNGFDWSDPYGELIDKKYTKKFSYAISTHTFTFPNESLRDGTYITDTGMKFIWGDSGASKYAIEYTKEDPTFTNPSDQIITGLTGNLTNLIPDTGYNVRIRAINGDDELTPVNALNPESCTAPRALATRPPAPYDLRAKTVTDTQIIYSWSTGTCTTSHITGYVLSEKKLDTDGEGVTYVYYDPVAVFPGRTTNTGLDPENLKTNSIITRYVSAEQNVPGYFSPGSFVSCPGATACTFATPPNDVYFDTVTSRTASLWWKHPDIPATKYRIERSLNIGDAGPWTALADVEGNRFVDTGLQQHTTYSYRIGAINQLGILTTGLTEATTGNRRNYSFVSSTQTMYAGPTFYGFGVSTDSVCWNWQDPLGASSFVIYTATNGVLNSSLTSSTTSWIETITTGADSLTTRRIKSVTPFCVTDFSDAACYSMANPPTDLIVSSATMHALSLAWNGHGTSRYVIDRSTDAINWQQIVEKTTAFTSDTYTDTQLHYNTGYTYRVASFNRDGLPSPNPATASNTTSGIPSYATELLKSAAGTTTHTASLAGYGQISLSVPAGATPLDGYVYINTSAGLYPTDTTLANMYLANNKLKPSTVLSNAIIELKYFDAYGSTVTVPFNDPVRLTIPFIDANNDHFLDNSTTKVLTQNLHIFTLDTVKNEWTQAPASIIDLANKQVHADLTHFSVYALTNLIPLKTNIGEAIAYPNPYKPGSGTAFDSSMFGEGIVFEGLTPRANIRIFNIAGTLVADLTEDDGDGRYVWDARNMNGEKVASGMYIYLIHNADNSSDKISGKLAIIK